MPERTADEWRKDSQSFDKVADLYDTYRPDYPEKLVDLIVSLSGIPQDGNILEIGCGTGKATRLFARRGYSIHCVEPGRNMAAAASRNLLAYPRVRIEISRFEEIHDHQAEFDLVMAASSFHWISGETGYKKANGMLKPDGTLALYWNMSAGFQGQITNKFAPIYREIISESFRSLSSTEDLIRERYENIEKSGFFNNITVHRFPWTRSYQTREYLGLLNTYSDHLRLDETTRQRLFRAIARVLDNQGGTIIKKYISVLYTAKKLE